MTFPHTEKLERRRATVADEAAFTLIELLVVVAIIGALLAIAVPSYLGFRARAQSTTAAADIREAISDANAYYASNNDSYTGMTPGSLHSTYDSGLVISTSGSTGIVSVKPADAGQTYCISAVSGGRWAHYSGPGGTVVSDPSSVSADPCS